MTGVPDRSDRGPLSVLTGVPVILGGTPRSILTRAPGEDLGYVLASVLQGTDCWAFGRFLSEAPFGSATREH